jgi:hypothetical protein
MSLMTRTTLLICSMAPAFGLLLETSACGPSQHDGTAHCDNEIHRADPTHVDALRRFMRERPGEPIRM